MTTRESDRARIPGPVGITPGTVVGAGGRLPGPLGFRSIVLMAPGALAKAATMTKMPPPANDQRTKDVREVTWSLFNPKGIPAYDEVKQASSLANCPVASILAALAYTQVGRTYIQGLVSETAGNVLTDLSALQPTTLTNPPSSTTISSSRYFTVKLRGGSIDVSDILYTDDADSGWSLIYMQDPRDRSIWAAIIEKALAVKLESYEKFDALNITANDFWERVTGVRPGGVEIKADTPLTTITDAAKASTRVPSIGASKPENTKHVTEFHGYAMMGIQGSKIQLYDPAKAKTLLIAPVDFREDFVAILFRR